MNPLQTKASVLYYLIHTSLQDKKSPCYIILYMRNKYCSHCKDLVGPFTRSAHYHNKKGELLEYFVCRKCNTERLKLYRATERGRLAARHAVYRSIKKHHDRQRARNTLNRAIRVGKVERPTLCSVCLNIKSTEAHHHDYRKPFDVIWVCRQCHCTL